LQCTSCHLPPLHVPSQSEILSQTRQRLEETTTKLKLLKAQHEYAEATIKHQGDKVEEILVLHGEYKSKYSTVKKELQYYREENEVLEVKVSQLDELKEQVDELTQQNHFLESQVTRLCHSPMFKSSKEEEHHKEKDMLRGKIFEMQNAHLIMAQECNQLKRANEELYSQLRSDKNYSSRGTEHDDQPTSDVDRIQIQLKEMEQKCKGKDSDLNQVNQLLKAQICINESLQSQINSDEKESKTQIQALEAKVSELSLRSSNRLQRIRMLENYMEMTSLPLREDAKSLPLRLGPSENALVVHISDGSFTAEGLMSNTTKSFVLLDFHSYESQLSPLASGASPSYDFSATYKMEVDRPLLQALVDGQLIIEVYVLQANSPPKLFAYANVSTSILFRPSAATQMPKLELLSAENDDLAGRLNVTMRLAQPITHPIGDVVSQEEYGCDSMVPSRSRVIPNAICIKIDRVKLSSKSRDEGSYFLHYRLHGYSEVTSLAECNQGVIQFQHDARFPLLSSTSMLIKGSLQLVLFASGVEQTKKFGVVGEGLVALREVLQQGEASVQIVSLEAKVVGSIHLSGSTSLTSINITDDPKQSKVRVQIISQVEELFTTLQDPDDTDGSPTLVKVDRVMQFINPPRGIVATATSLQQQIETNFPEGSASEALSLPPDAERINQSEFRRCVDNTRCSGVLSLPPNDELLDLFLYLSNDSGLTKIRELDYFVASQRLSTRVLQKLSKLSNQDDIQLKTMGDEVNVETLKEFFVNSISRMDEEELSFVFSTISP